MVLAGAEAALLSFYPVAVPPWPSPTSIQSIRGRVPRLRLSGERLCLFPRDDAPHERRRQRTHHYDQAQADGGVQSDGEARAGSVGHRSGHQHTEGQTADGEAYDPQCAAAHLLSSDQHHDGRLHGPEARGSESEYQHQWKRDGVPGRKGE